MSSAPTGIAQYESDREAVGALDVRVRRVARAAGVRGAELRDVWRHPPRRRVYRQRQHPHVGHAPQPARRPQRPSLGAPAWRCRRRRASATIPCHWRAASRRAAGREACGRIPAQDQRPRGKGRALHRGEREEGGERAEGGRRRLDKADHPRHQRSDRTADEEADTSDSSKCSAVNGITAAQLSAPTEAARPLAIGTTKGSRHANAVTTPAATTAKMVACTSARRS